VSKVQQAIWGVIVALISINTYEAVGAAVTPPPPADTTTVWHVTDGVTIHRMWTTHDTCYIAIPGGSLSCLRGQ